MVSPRTIMVVDDDAAIRETLCEVLGDEGYATLSASDGQQALDLLRSGIAKPDLILLDVMMPILDGRGFRKAQRLDTDLWDIPVIIITAGNINLADGLGADTIIRKPILLDVLISTVRMYCGVPVAVVDTL